MPTITYTAADEIARRAANKGLPKGSKLPSPKGNPFFSMSGPELKAIVGENTPAPATTPKAAPKEKAVRTQPTAQKPLTPYQKAVLADPTTYGEGFGTKRKARGLAPLTPAQREARKVLFASL